MEESKLLVKTTAPFKEVNDGPGNIDFYITPIQIHRCKRKVLHIGNSEYWISITYKSCGLQFNLFY